MINYAKYEWKDNIKVTLTDNSVFIGNGDGFSLAEDFDDPEDQWDSFFLLVKGGGVRLRVDEIKSIESMEETN